MQTNTETVQWRVLVHAPLRLHVTGHEPSCLVPRLQYGMNLGAR